MPRRRSAPKIPSALKRRTTGPKPPLGVARSYAGVIRGWLGRVQAFVLEHVLAGWESNPVAFSGALPSTASKFDASEFVTKKLGVIKVALEQRLDPSKLAPEIAKFGKRIETQNGEEMRRVIGISSSDLGVKTELAAFQKTNVALVKSLAATTLDDLRGTLDEAEKGAWRVEELSKKIQEDFGVSQSKGDLIARDQTLKLNGQLTETRQTNAGILKYIWTTSNDERVRPDHAALDGTVQSWAVKPVCARSKDGEPLRHGHPGEDYQCRCIAFPVLEELDEPPPEE